MENEVWKPVVGFETAYVVNNLGVVKGIERVEINSIGNSRTIKERVLKYITDKTGYVRVKLCSPEFNQQYKRYFVHRVVLSAFIPIPFDGAEVNHKNGIKTDNRLENLEWCTRLENIRHSANNGLRKDLISDKVVDDIIKLRNQGMKMTAIASQLNIGTSSVSRWINKYK